MGEKIPGLGGAIATIIVIVCVVVGVFIGIMWGIPQYRVYSQRMDGEAILAKAQSERRVLVETANAKLDASKLEAQAEIERAKGVAASNEIIADGLKDNENYLKYLWITKLGENGNAPTVIYVPTEAGLPVLEAGKRP